MREIWQRSATVLAFQIIQLEDDKRATPAGVAIWDVTQRSRGARDVGKKGRGGGRGPGAGGRRGSGGKGRRYEPVGEVLTTTITSATIT